LIHDISFRYRRKQGMLYGKMLFDPTLRNRTSATVWLETSSPLSLSHVKVFEVGYFFDNSNR